MNRLIRKGFCVALVLGSGMLGSGLMGRESCSGQVTHAPLPPRPLEPFGSAAPGSISEATPPTAETPLFVGITVHKRPVANATAEAQRYFDQGLNLAFAFNHDEAIRSFRQSLRFAPQCAMAWWGIALCHGPHINNPLMAEDHSRAAWEAIGKAKACVDMDSPLEKALIDALEQRYVADTKENIAERDALNRRYADAMKQVHDTFPLDLDVTVLYAESLMDLRPWDLWSDEGEPRPETPIVLALLEQVMASAPNHPGANHLYIHAVEGSANPQRAEAAADRLRTLMPGSGHLVHMPSHIDVRTGKWDQASDQNEIAIAVDRVYRQASPQQEFYSVYMIHNPHFLSFACMMEGRRERAVKAAREMLALIPPEFLDQSAPLADPFMAIEHQTLVRFGQWDQVLALPAPRADLPITTAMGHFARATAFAAKQDHEAAQREQALFRAAVSAVPEQAVGAINKAHDILRVAEHVLSGELAFQQGDIDRSIAELKQGVAAETKLLYMEPPEWIQPVRHSLGAVLVADERWDEAEQVYREDLVQWPENGWALYGLSQCLKAKGELKAAGEMMQRYQTAWRRADTEIGSTCLCVPQAAIR